MPTVALSIPPDTENVRTARLVAGAAARRTGIDEEALEEVRLAVGEACARAVLRHQAEAETSAIVVELNDDDRGFSVRVIDHVVDAPDEDEAQLALTVISALVPESSLTSEASGTVVTMRWPAVG
ncbi:MAG: ATP-binding protein [Candidatus Nanopelagicales bacterium]